jgi:hypothetical protein
MTVSKPRAALREWLVSGLTPAAEPRELLAEAGRQGLVGLLAAQPGFLAGLAEDLRGEWRRAAQRLLVRGAHQLDLARRVMDLLAAASLRALPLKGAALAERLYASVAERPMADVDVLVLDRPEHAQKRLEGEGFRVVERADHAIALREPESGGIVELHRTLTSCGALFPIDGEGLWFRRRHGEGAIAHSPSAADLLVALALHAAFQHGLVLSLVQFLDLRRLLERERPTLEAVLEVAAAARAEGALLVALAAARAVVGAQPAPALVHALEARVSEPVRRLARTVEGGDPLRHVAPARPSLAATRLALASGRRLELLTLTLCPPPWPGDPRRRIPEALLAGARRAWRLAGQEMARP